MSAISVRNLTKYFGEVHAVDGISFEVPEGSFFAFLGPNGAGKSTTISIICSLLRQDSGEAEVFGKPATDPEARRSIGVVFQESLLDKLLTVRENLALRGRMYGLEGEELERAVGEAIEAAEAEEFAGRRYGTLSGGQRRRADIARALIHRPRLLILDEPTAGLDPQSRKTMWDTISALNRERGITVLLTTHYMEEAAGADDVVIIKNGRIAAQGTPAELRSAVTSDRMMVRVRDRLAAEHILASMGHECAWRGGALEIPLESTLDALPLIEALKGQMESFEVREGSLDDAFIRITEGDE